MVRGDESSEGVERVKEEKKMKKMYEERREEERERNKGKERKRKRNEDEILEQLMWRVIKSNFEGDQTREEGKGDRSMNKR